jgi:regulation of enolase protein 1 (concanavalin A-like superfamily)
MVLVLTLLGEALAEKPAINGVPGGLTWQNVPVAWHVEHDSELTIRSGKETDWFVDPFDGTVHNTAPMLLLCRQMTTSSAQR